MNKRLTLILCLAFAIELYFFSVSVSNHQTEWWDSTEYLLKAKSMAFGTPSTGFAAHREVVPALIWYPFFKLGVGEIGIRVFMALLGLFGVYLAYLTGKEVYNENVGLITSFLMSTFYLYYFYMNRLTMYVFAPVLFMAALYFFWRYHKGKGTRNIYVSFIIIALGITIYYNTAFALFIIGAYLFTINRKFFKDKHIWFAGIVAILTLMPYFIYSQLTFGFPLPRLAETARAAAAEGGGSLWHSLTAYPKLLPSMLQLPLFIMLIIGLILMYKLILGFDMVIKGKLEEQRPNLFAVYWIIIPLVLYSWTVASLAGGMVVMPEYIMIIFPAIFMAIGNALMIIHEKIATKTKAFAGLLVSVVLIISMIMQMNMLFMTTQSKLGSFAEIQEASQIIKQNTAPTDYVATASVPQVVYYSERDVIGISVEETIDQFRAKVAQYKPVTLLWSRYEPHPAWINEYIQTTNMSIIKMWGDQANPTAALMVFNDNIPR